MEPFRAVAGRDLRTGPVLLTWPWNWAWPATRVALLQRRYAQAPSIDVVEAIVALGGQLQPTGEGREATTSTPRDGYLAHLTQQPGSLVAASR